MEIHLTPFHILRGHSDSIWCCDISSDDSTLISGALDKTIRVWDNRTGKCIQVISDHDFFHGQIDDCAFSPDNRWILSASQDNTLKLWEIGSDKCLHTYSGHTKDVVGCDFSPDGKTIASVSHDDTLRIWDPITGDCIKIIADETEMGNFCRYSPDGGYLLTGGEVMILRDAKNYDIVQQIRSPNHSEDVPHVFNRGNFSPDGTKIISGAYDSSIFLWDVKTGQQIREFKGHKEDISQVSFSPDGKLLISGSWDGDIRLWDVNSGDCLKKIHVDLVYDCAFSKSGNYIISVHDDQTVRVWKFSCISTEGSLIKTEQIDQKDQRHQNDLMMNKEEIGINASYYMNKEVASVILFNNVAIRDWLTFEGPLKQHVQILESMQLDRQIIREGEYGQRVGMKTNRQIEIGEGVFRINSIFRWKQLHSQILDDLLPFSKKICFLAGSGISNLSPSNLPTGDKLVHTIFEKYLPEEYLGQILGIYKQSLENSIKQFLKYEQICDYIKEIIDPNLDFLSVVENCHSPNFYHFFLAQMMVKNHTIMTTNFDSLIEESLLELDIPAKSINPVILKNDWLNYGIDDPLTIFKIHGSFYNVKTNKKTRDSVITTISQIARGKSKIFNLEDWKYEKLKTILQNRDLVILGYSGSDEFDIIPSLWEMKSDRKLIWIKHDPTVSIKNIQIETIEVIDPAKFPEILPQLTLDEYKDPDFLSKFYTNGSRKPESIFRITVNTNDLIHWCWNRFLEHLSPEITSYSYDPDYSAIHQVEEYDKYIFAGRIFRDSSELNLSFQAYNKALLISLKNKNQTAECECLSHVARVYDLNGEANLAFKNFLKALDLAEKLKDNKLIADNSKAIGILAMRIGELDKIKENFQKAETVYEKLGLYDELLGTLGNIGIYYQNVGDLDNAIKITEKAIKIAREIGALPGLTAQLLNLGVYLIYKGRYTEAESALTNAYEISHKRGNLHQESMVLSNLGLLNYRNGKLNVAILKYLQAYKIDIKLNDTNHQNRVLNSIATILALQGRANENIKYLQLALDLEEKSSRLKMDPTNLMERVTFEMFKNKK